MVKRSPLRPIPPLLPASRFEMFSLVERVYIVEVYIVESVYLLKPIFKTTFSITEIFHHLEMQYERIVVDLQINLLLRH